VGGWARWEGESEGDSNRGRDTKSDEECVSELKSESARSSGSVAALEENGVKTLQIAVCRSAAMTITCMNRDVL
jgi:hypothetical protein